MNRRIVAIRQETRPPNLRDTIIERRRIRPDAGERLTLRAQGLVIGIVIACVVVWLSGCQSTPNIHLECENGHVKSYTQYIGTSLYIDAQTICAGSQPTATP